jgi:hypothetical protein
MTPHLPDHSVRRHAAATRLVLTIAVLALLFAAGGPVFLAGNEAQRTWLQAAPEAASLAGLLSRDYPEAFNASAREAVENAFADFGQAGRARWLVVSQRTALSPDQIREDLLRADSRTEVAAQQMAAALAKIPDLIHLEGGDQPVAVHRAVSLPFHSGVLLVQRQQPHGIVPAFARTKIDLRLPSPIHVEGSGARKPADRRQRGGA